MNKVSSIAVQLIDHCDAVLGIGSAFKGTDEMVSRGEKTGKIFFYRKEEIPDLNQLK